MTTVNTTLLVGCISNDNSAVDNYNAYGFIISTKNLSKQISYYATPSNLNDPSIQVECIAVNAFDSYYNYLASILYKKSTLDGESVVAFINIPSALTLIQGT